MKNRDTITVRQTASSNLSTATTATLTVGGLAATNNAGVPLGTTTSAAFTSTTTATASGGGGGGGGAFSLASLLLLGLFGTLRRATFSA